MSAPVDALDNKTTANIKGDGRIDSDISSSVEIIRLTIIARMSLSLFLSIDRAI